MHKLGWHASDTRELSFKDCAVPEGNLLGQRGKGFQQFMEILDGGRISVAAMGVGLAQGAYDLAFAYAQERQQFGRPISKFQAVQFALADMATEIEAGRQLVYRAAWLKDQGKPFGLAAAQAKLYTGLLSNRAANAALQIHGGYGFMEEYAISRLYRDQKILEIGEGTNEVQRMVIAKLLGLCRWLVAHAAWSASARSSSPRSRAGALRPGLAALAAADAPTSPTGRALALFGPGLAVVAALVSPIDSIGEDDLLSRAHARSTC